MADFRVVIPDDYPPMFESPENPDLAPLEGLAEVVLESTKWKDRKDFFSRIASANAVINVRGYSKFDAEALAHAPELKLISVLGTGVDNIDLAEATRRDIVVSNTPAVGAQAVAELAIGLMFAVSRHIAVNDREVRMGVWRHGVSHELRGKTIGLVGLGAIGQAMAVMTAGMGMRVIAWNRTSGREAELNSTPVEMVGWDELFERSDVVAIHLRSTPETAGIVGPREIGLMKPSAILLNTARAAVIDYGALAKAIREGLLAGAGLDVHSVEPLPPEENLFRDLDTVVLTPHSGAVTVEANQRSMQAAVENITRFLDGRPHHVMNP
jgi:phosphoglycerate dehydrogenase-like enzyme